MGQVASQTMDALAVSGDVTDLPVLRPVIGMDKEEIVSIARDVYKRQASISIAWSAWSLTVLTITKPPSMTMRSLACVS